MKLRVAFAVLFSTAYFFSNAQKIQYGLTSAVTFNNVNGNGMGTKYQTGFDAGAFAVLPLSKKFSLQPELLYNFMKVARGTDFTTFYVNESRAAAKASFNLAYISVPVLINYRLNKSFTVNAGPQYNILAYSNEDLMYGKQAFKNNDFGLRGGFQFAPSNAISLFASYYYGLSNINNIDDRYAWKNRQFQTGITVSIFNGK